MQSKQMDRAKPKHGFGFALEMESMLIDARSFAPLSHRELNFSKLRKLVEAIELDDLILERDLGPAPLHRNGTPYLVDGYFIYDENNKPVDILPKGVVIRTPRVRTVTACLGLYRALYDRLQLALTTAGYRAVSLASHPTEGEFHGPKQIRSVAAWMQDLRSMVSYGARVSISLPFETWDCLDFDELLARSNFYLPALTALTLASPLNRGGVWALHGKPVKGLRTYRCASLEPVVHFSGHPEWSFTLNCFEPSAKLRDLECYFLLWLELLLDPSLDGRASDERRIFEMSKIAFDGLGESAADAAGEVIQRARAYLPTHGFDTTALNVMAKRLKTGQSPADEIIDWYEITGSIASVLRLRADQAMEKRAPLCLVKTERTRVDAQAREFFPELFTLNSERKGR